MFTNFLRGPRKTELKVGFHRSAKGTAHKNSLSHKKYTNFFFLLKFQFKRGKICI